MVFTMAGKKDEIIRATVDYIAENGISDVSSKKIAEKAGCSDALIYKYFPTKEALIKGCLDHLEDLNKLLFFEEMPKAIEGITDPIEKMRVLTKLYLQHHITYWEETLTFNQISKSSFDSLISDYFKRLHYTNLSEFAKEAGFEEYEKELAKVVPVHLWWYHLAQTTTFFVKRIKKGVLPDDDSTYDLYFKLLIFGVESAGFGRQME